MATLGCTANSGRERARPFFFFFLSLAFFFCSVGLHRRSRARASITSGFSLARTSLNPRDTDLRTFLGSLRLSDGPTSSLGFHGRQRGYPTPFLRLPASTPVRAHRLDALHQRLTNGDPRSSRSCAGMSTAPRFRRDFSWGPCVIPSCTPRQSTPCSDLCYGSNAPRPIAGPLS